MKQLNRALPALAALALLVTVNSFAAKMDMHTSSQVQGPKANTGTVTHYVENGKSMLKVSDDFKVPDTPRPTVNVVMCCHATRSSSGPLVPTVGTLSIMLGRRSVT